MWLYLNGFFKNLLKTIQKIYNPKPLTQIARDKIKLDDEQFEKKLAKKMNNPHFFTDRNLKVWFKINLVTHHINHANSKLTFTPNKTEFGIEVRYINKITKKLSVIYARVKNQYKFKSQTVFQKDSISKMQIIKY